MKRLNRNMHGDDPAFHRLPDDPELAAQYLLLYELSLPFGSDLNNRIDVGKSRTRMTVALRSLTSRQQRELDARAQAWLGANAPELATPASGVSIVFAHLSQRNIESMLRGTIIAMALISLILIGVFRSVRLGLVSLVPNFLPAAMSFGLWGYLVGRVGLAGSVMVAIAFGIIVDDTIHFLSKYLGGPARGLRFRGRGALGLSRRRPCAHDHHGGAFAGIPGVRHLGLRGELGAGPDGHDDHRLRAPRRLPAPSSPADGDRSKEVVSAAPLPAAAGRHRGDRAERRPAGTISRVGRAPPRSPTALRRRAARAAT